MHGTCPTPRTSMYTQTRKAPRFPFVALVEVIELHTDTRLKARTSDLSRQGCYVDTLNPMPDGTTLRLHFNHQDQELDAVGRVVHSQPNMGMGIQFAEIAASDPPILDRWLAGLTLTGKL
jgi:hypothetical protein